MRTARESNLEVLFRPVVRFPRATTSVLEDDEPRIVQVGIGADEHTNGLGFRQPASAGGRRASKAPAEQRRSGRSRATESAGVLEALQRGLALAEREADGAAAAPVVGGVPSVCRGGRDSAAARRGGGGVDARVAAARACAHGAARAPRPAQRPLGGAHRGAVGGRGGRRRGVRAAGARRGPDGGGGTAVAAARPRRAPPPRRRSRSRRPPRRGAAAAPRCNGPKSRRTSARRRAPTPTRTLSPWTSAHASYVADVQLGIEEPTPPTLCSVPNASAIGTGARSATLVPAPVQRRRKTALPLLNCFTRSTNPGAGLGFASQARSPFLDGAAHRALGRGRRSSASTRTCTRRCGRPGGCACASSTCCRPT